MRFILSLTLVGVIGCGNSGLNGGDDMGLGDMAMATDDMNVGGDAGSTNCDPVAQTGCATGQKCALSIGGTQMNPTIGGKCETNGTVPLGQACMRSMTAQLDSNCEGGAFCTRTGGTMSTCHKICAHNSDCTGTNEACAMVLGTIGFCVAKCTPYGTDCAATTDCGQLEPGEGSTQNGISNGFYVCKVTGAGTAFSDCMRPSNCGANMDCDQNNGWCTPLCSLSGSGHTCPMPPADGGTTVSCTDVSAPSFGECL